MLLNLCGRSRFIIPLIVWTAGCKSQNEVAASLRYMFNYFRITTSTSEEELEEDLDDDDENLIQISITEIAILVLFIIL